MRPFVPPPAALFASVLLATLPALPARAADPGIPRDARGLPLWEVREFTDFPVRIELAGPRELAALLERVPIASFDREQIRPGRPSAGEPPLLFEPRITPEEADALRRAAIPFTLVEDSEQAVRRANEAEWLRQAADDDRAALDLGTRGVYHTHAQVGAILAQAAADHPDIAQAFTVGTSVLGRAIWAIRITDSPGVEENEPEVRLAASIHGDEPPPLEMLLYLVDHLTSGYGTDPDVTELVDGTDLVIIPSLNPDGLVAGTRRNAHNVDLNRNYPVPNGTIGDDGTYAQEAETVALRTWSERQSFVVSTNGHTGSLVVNYPWDYTYTLAPDDAALILLSLEYSTWNLPMYNGAFPQGITNGAAWYVVRGSLQDWSYADTGCIDVTVEMSNVKTPPASALDGLWDDNRESLLHYIRAARYGLRGIVTDAWTGEPLEATVSVAGIPKDVFTDPDVGDYGKLLPTGTWDVFVSAPGYLPESIPGVSTVWGTTTLLDVALTPEANAVGPIPSAAGVALRVAPNPAPGASRVLWSHPGPAEGAALELDVRDVAGRRVRRLLAGPAPATGEIAWDGRGDDGAPVASGVYFVRLVAPEGARSTRVVLTR